MIERSGDMPNDTKIVDTVSRRIVRDELEKTNMIKHIPAIVTEVPADKKNGVAKVFTLGRTLTLLNKSGELLKVGDGVVIHYWDNIANGYIALRCGLPVFKIDSSGGETYTGELPLHEETEIDNAYVLHEGNKETFYGYSYDTNGSQVSSTSFATTDYNAISSVSTRSVDRTDYKSVGSAGYAEIFWGSGSFGSGYDDVSCNFTTFDSFNGSAVVSDEIVPFLIRIVKTTVDGVLGIYAEVTIDNNAPYYVEFAYGDLSIEDYGLVLHLSNAMSVANSHADVEYHRKTDSMVYNASIRMARRSSDNEWHFIPLDEGWGYKSIALKIVINSYPQMVPHTLYNVEQTETIR